MRAGIIVMGILLGACQTVQERGSAAMAPYMGKPITDIIARLGPPNATYDMSPGERAFQWTHVDVRSTPGMLIPMQGIGVMAIPSQQNLSQCRLTLTAKASAPEPHISQWLITSWQAVGSC